MSYVYESELYHHGVLGQKWGVRRYQNKDGTLTAAGKKRQQQSNYNELVKTAAKIRSETAGLNRFDSVAVRGKAMYDNSETMKKYAEATKDEYAKRADAYDHQGDDEYLSKIYGQREYGTTSLGTSMI